MFKVRLSTTPLPHYERLSSTYPTTSYETCREYNASYGHHSSHAHDVQGTDDMNNLSVLSGDEGAWSDYMKSVLRLEFGLIARGVVEWWGEVEILA